MAEIVVEIFARVVLELVGTIITNATCAHFEQKRKKKSISSAQKQNRQVPTQHNRAVLISSSNVTFGNDCERLVNTAFETSRNFPTMMKTYGDISSYLRKELAKQYPNEFFHIIIGNNQHFGSSIDDGQYFAEIQEARYTVLIFTTKQNSQLKFDTHDANSQMSIVWH
ncbi:hypothetical protein I4U23_009716 [Adineta vaga]|nr:hypothetical protein I4U23_009716 [Adineta vaga]